MVGHHGGYEHMSETVEHSRKQHGVAPRHTNQPVEYAQHEHGGICCAEHIERGDEENGEVEARHFH